MKIYIVPSSLFVSGNIGRAYRLEQERDAMIALQARVQKQLDTYPAKIAELSAACADAQLQIRPYRAAEFQG